MLFLNFERAPIRCDWQSVSKNRQNQAITSAKMQAMKVEKFLTFFCAPVNAEEFNHSHLLEFYVVYILLSVMEIQFERAWKSRFTVFTKKNPL